MAEQRTTHARLRAIWGSAIGYHRLSAHFEPAIDELLGFLEIGPDDTVLDVATGTGRAAVAARRRGATVTCQDIAPVLLSEAEHHALEEGYQDIQIDESDAEHLPYQDRAFDVVISAFGIPHVPRADEAVREMDRVLRVSGRLGLLTWRHDALIHEMYRLFLPYRVPEPVEISHAEWGHPTRIREYISKRSFPELIHREGELSILYPDSDSAWTDWVRNYGPFHLAFGELARDEQAVVRRSALELLGRGRNADGSVAMRLPYLLTRATKASAGSRLG